MINKMTDKDFLDNGFKQFKPIPRIDNEGIETKFQKRYDDDIGRKYFITVNKWMAMQHPYTSEVFPSQYEYSVQLYKKDFRHEVKAVDLLFHCTWTLQEVEECVEKLFDTGLFDYYEKWDLEGE